MAKMASDSEREEIRQRIRRLRIEHNMTQKELARGGYSESYISSIERGTVKISERALRWIALRLGVSVPELRGESMLDSPDAQRFRQELGRHTYEQIYAQLLITCGQIEEGLKRVDWLRSDVGGAAERSLIWFSAYGALQEGKLEEATREAEEYQRLVEVANEPRSLAALHWLRGRIALQAGNASDAHREFTHALEADPDAFGDPDTAQAIRCSLAAARRALGDLAGAHEIEGDALREYERFTDPAQSLRWARARAEKAASANDYVTASLLIRWAWSSQRDSAVHRHAAELYLRYATYAGENLSWERREAALRRAVMLAELTRESEIRLLAAAYLAQSLAERGALAVAEEVMRLTTPAAGDESDPPPTGDQDVALKLARGWLAVARGNQEAEAEARRLALDVDVVLGKMPRLALTDMEYAGRALSRLFERLSDTKHAMAAFKRATRPHKASR